MKLLAIDPGDEMSALLVYTDSPECLDSHGIFPNERVLELIDELALDGVDECVIEMVASYGMAIGRDVLETIFWIGRFAERWEARRGSPAARLIRRQVKMHLCHNATANDSNLRAALIDRFGPGKAKAVGTKKDQGPLYGVKADIWQALALAVTYAEQLTDLDSRTRAG